MTYPLEKPIPAAPDSAGAAAEAVQSTGGSVSLPAAEPGDSAVVRPYVNDRLNSRIGVSVPEGVWEVRWQADLAPGLEPAFVLRAGNRILVQGRDLWQLFDRMGESVAVQRVAGSDVVLDPVNKLLYHAMPNGTLGAYQWAEERPAFTLMLLFGAEFERVYFARRGPRMVVASVEQRVDPHAPEPTELALVEVQDLGDPPRASDMKILTSAQLLASVQRKTNVLHAAMNDDTLVVATPGLVEFFDIDLQPAAHFEGRFTPRALSLDEMGRVYLIVEAEDASGETHPALWILSANAEIQVEVAIPAHPAGVYAYSPPIVGYDHRVYVLLGNRVLALSPEGETLWTTATGEAIAGAVVTADGKLLVTAGGVLLSLDAGGERKGIFLVDGDRWTTPPVLTDRQRVLVASERHLYCLQLQP